MMCEVVFLWMLCAPPCSGYSVIYPVVEWERKATVYEGVCFTEEEMIGIFTPLLGTDIGTILRNLK